MKALVTAIAVFCAPKALATTKIAIVDTGYSGTTLKLCETGHYDFIEGREGVGRDGLGHGTAVGNIIADELEGKDYCAVILRVADYGTAAKRRTEQIPARVIAQAMFKAAEVNVQFTNISIAGPGGSSEEAYAIWEVTEKTKMRVFAAAGNQGRNIDQLCDVFPACYKIQRLFMVGAKCNTQVSNYGSRVDMVYDGHYGYECASSYATPRALADFFKRGSFP